MGSAYFESFSLRLDSSQTVLLDTLSLVTSLSLGGYTYATVFNFPARRQSHSVFGAFVHAGIICLLLDP